MVVVSSIMYYLENELQRLYFTNKTMGNNRVVSTLISRASLFWHVNCSNYVIAKQIQKMFYQLKFM